MSVSFGHLTSLQLPSHATDLVRLEHSLELPSLTSRLRQSPRLILGGGSNLVVRSTENEPLDVTVIRNDIRGIVRLPADGNAVGIRCAAGENWHRFVMWTLSQGLGGLENLSLIPGTVGAAPIQNIGAYGVELSERVSAVHAWDFEAAAHRVFGLTECAFGYRSSRFKDPSRQGPWNRPRYLITAVDFALWPAHRAPRVVHYPGLEGLCANGPEAPMQIAHAVMSLRRKKLPDPDQIANVGSFFQNPQVPAPVAASLLETHPTMPVHPGVDGVKLSAGWLIDSLGLKGSRHGQAGVYDHHALVLVNHGGASAEELLWLARDIQQRVLARYGVWLEPEPTIVPPVERRA
ncbi:MAG: UDP-N-acetylmuramate dehydrogenase [Proteobacteria bacterium]|nr:UDP-N-acetylmuramate dehydrogenase [Pseudomonadota bacterium]